MSLPHEDAARAHFDSARDFQPVHTRPKGLFGRRKGDDLLAGWVFEVNLPNSSLEHYAWITTDYRVTSDPARTAAVAAKRLLAYCEYLKALPGSTAVSPLDTPSMEAVPAKHFSSKDEEK